MRAQHKNDAERIVDRAVQVARRTSPPRIQSVPIDAAPSTWAVTDEDGTVHTAHPFMVGIDEVGDEYAPLAPPED